ncbi:MAG: ATP-binding cassette domain-containing protein [Deltaproteobacteria bacterium]|jgi:ABC-type multidrug transport system fused ATPase/permease subunit|nr:ATP-binding cassette domain-containing protein [Deltaproteobacteria bacterium]
MENLRLITPYFRRSLFSLGVGLASLTLCDFGQMWVPLLVGGIIDSLAGASAAAPGIASQLAVIVCLAAGVAVTRYLWRNLIYGFSRSMEKDLRARLYARFVSLSVTWHNRNSSGDLMALATNDIESVRLAVGFGLVSLVDSVVLGTAAVVFMLSISPALCLWAFLPLPLITVLTAVFGRRIFDSFLESQNIFGELTEAVREHVSGFKVIRAMALESLAKSEIDREGVKYMRRNVRLSLVMGLFFPFLNLLANLAVALTLFFGGRAAIAGEISPGDFVAFLSYLGLLAWPLMAMGLTLGLIQQGLASLARLSRVLSAREALPHPPAPFPGDVDEAAGAETPSGRPRPLPRDRRGTEAAGVPERGPAPEPARAAPPWPCGEGAREAAPGPLGEGAHGSPRLAASPEDRASEGGPAKGEGGPAKAAAAELRSAAGDLSGGVFEIEEALAAAGLDDAAPDSCGQYGDSSAAAGPDGAAPAREAAGLDGAAPAPAGPAAPARVPAPRKPGGSPPDVSRLLEGGFAIAFEDVSYTYPGRADKALSGFSAELDPSGFTALTGPTGSGKSTLASLLPALLEPDEGRILIDGSPSTEYRLDDLRSLFGLVPQEGHIFTGTLLENIRFGKPGATEEEAAGAAEAAGLRMDPEVFPEGLGTRVGEKGITLSGGQKQRAALARALLLDPPYLILDDTLSAVDASIEEEILNTLVRVRKGRGTLVVSHRVTSLKRAGTFLVLEKGVLTASGGFRDLSSKPGYFKRIVDLAYLGEKLADAADAAEAAMKSSGPRAAKTSPESSSPARPNRPAGISAEAPAGPAADSAVDAAGDAAEPGTAVKPETSGKDVKPETAGKDVKPETAGKDVKPETAGKDVKPETAGKDGEPAAAAAARDRNARAPADGAAAAGAPGKTGGGGK